VFLDEISWMAEGDPKFVSVLKQTFDTELQNNKNLTIVLCGSVSFWICDHILNSKDFLGRINQDLHLGEMTLNEAKLFFPKQTSELEMLLFLLHTGGVPRYLKEYKKSMSSAAQIADMSFDEGGLFFNEF